MTIIQPPLIGGKTIEQWDRLWVVVPGGVTRYHPQLRHQCGLYRMSLGGQITVVGTGTDKDGGLAKRLSDFRRSSRSARNHYAGELIYTHRDELVVEVLITGSGPDARENAQQLKTPMILLHKPVWTVSNAPYRRKGMMGEELVRDSD